MPNTVASGGDGAAKRILLPIDVRRVVILRELKVITRMAADVVLNEPISGDSLFCDSPTLRSSETSSIAQTISGP